MQKKVDQRQQMPYKIPINYGVRIDSASSMSLVALGVYFECAYHHHHYFIYVIRYAMTLIDDEQSHILPKQSCTPSKIDQLKLSKIVVSHFLLFLATSRTLSHSLSIGHFLTVDASHRFTIYTPMIFSWHAEISSNFFVRYILSSWLICCCWLEPIF